MSRYDFAETAPGILVVTADDDDLVLSYPSFQYPITAYLGKGSDVFVGGAGGDEAHGGADNDALLGEGWDTSVTSLESLFQDMLDLNFTLAGGAGASRRRQRHALRRRGR